jgi:short-subunit dehydrogenase
MRVSPEAVVRAGYNGMKRGRSLVIPGALNNVIVFLVRLSPRGMATAAVRRLQTASRD